MRSLVFDILAVLPQKLGAALGVPCSTTVPRERPDSFVTVERTGGPYGPGRDNPYLAVQTWARTETEAYTLALMAREWLTWCWEAIPEVCSVSVEGTLRFPDPDNRFERYQINVYMVTRP